MAAERLDQIKRLFEAALNKAPAERAVYLEAIGDSDRGLREEVESLLGCHDVDRLPEKVTAIRHSTGTDTRDRIGPYRILREIGEGGMGLVYEAEQQEPVRRKVALKLIKFGMDTKAVVARFESERQALAMMNHPNIASVYDAGATQEGRPFFAMEYVQGIPITQYCDKHRLTIKERLALFIQVCTGVQHAHQKGIIHRDIKPSNVLVAIQDDKAVPKIIDFGVAKATSQRLTERTAATELGQLIGTPEYMSPEQAEMTNLDIDTRTDVYSLGVLLYELLSGVQPFDPRELRQAGLIELQRMLREVEPPKPSAQVNHLRDRATTSAASRRVDVKTLRRHLTGDLDWITMKALEKDRTRRYETANALAFDVQRYLDDDPVLARAPSATYRLGKFVRKYKAGVGITALVLILAVAVAIAMTVQSSRIAEERDRASREAEAAREIAAFVVGLFRVADPTKGSGATVTAREILDQGAREASMGLAKAPLAKARFMETIGKAYQNLGLYNEAGPLLDSALATRERELGRDHAEVAESLNAIGLLLRSKGEHEHAESLLREALVIRRNVLPENDAEVTESLSSLGRLLRDRGRLEEAEPMLVEALDLRVRLLGTPHPLVAASMEELAGLSYMKGAYDTAASLMAQALEMRRLLFGKEHMEVARSLGNFAVVLQAQGDYEKAEAILLESVSHLRRILGNEHPEVALATHNLGLLYRLRGKFRESEQTLREAVEMWRHLVDDRHYRLGQALTSFGGILIEQGNSVEGGPVIEEAVTILRQALPDGHPYTVQAEIYRAAYLIRTREYTEAERLLLDCYERSTASTDRSLAEESLRFLVQLYQAWNKPQKAAEYRALKREGEKAKQ
jgi:serine/threonine protein kinase/tetratricopeptide (TPR) repeat protein